MAQILMYVYFRLRFGLMNFSIYCKNNPTIFFCVKFYTPFEKCFPQFKMGFPYFDMNLVLWFPYSEIVLSALFCGFRNFCKLDIDFRISKMEQSNFTCRKPNFKKKFLFSDVTFPIIILYVISEIFKSLIKNQL